MRLAAKKRHFAEKVSGLNIIQHFLPPAAALFRNFDRALANKIKRIPQISFRKNDITAVQLQDIDVRPNSFQHLCADALKETVLAQVLERFCGRLAHWFFFKQERRYWATSCLRPFDKLQKGLR